MFYYLAIILRFLFDAAFWKLIFTLQAGLLFILIVYIAYLHWKYDHIPGPPRWSFWLGHFTALYNCLGDNNAISKYLYENVKKFGHTVRFFMLHRAFVVVVDPPAVKDILTPGKHGKCSFTCKQDGYLFGARWQGSGLLTDYNEDRLVMRLAIFEPVFQKDYLKALLPEINVKADDVVAELLTLADGKTILSMSEQFERAMFDILCKAMFSREMDSIECQRTPLKQAVFNFLEARRREKNDPWTNISVFRRQLRKDVRQACALLRQTGSDWMTERKRNIDRNEVSPKDVLTTLIELSKVPGFTEEDVLDDFVVFLTSTLEHAPNVLSFLIREACRKPTVYRRLKEEVEFVMAGRPTVNGQDIDKLTYMDAVLRETLRIYPSDVEAIRVTRTPVMSKGYSIPVGTSVIVSPLLSGRDESLFKDPMEFDPERFTQNGHSLPDPSIYYPYTDKTRENLAQFGEIAMKVLLVKILQKLKVHVFPDQVFGETNLPTLRPYRGGIVVFSPTDVDRKYIYDV